jgi:uncharacterized membrane protein YraQ (UPF0718 family)
MMIRIFLAFSSVVLLGTLAAFLLFIPVLSIATVVCVLVGLTLMFALGVQVGTRQMVPAESAGK